MLLPPELLYYAVCASPNFLKPFLLLQYGYEILETWIKKNVLEEVWEAIKPYEDVF